jgi:hypothetical protein
MNPKLTVPAVNATRKELLLSEANSIIKVIGDLNQQIATAVSQRNRLEVVLSAIEASLEQYQPDADAPIE